MRQRGGRAGSRKFLAMIRGSGPCLSSFVFPNDQEGLFHKLVLPMKWDFGSDDEFPQGPFRYGITLSFGAAVPGRRDPAWGWGGPSCSVE